MLSDTLSLGVALFAIWLAGAADEPAAHVRQPAGRDPRRPLQRRHARRDLDLDLRRGGRCASATRPRCSPGRCSSSPAAASLVNLLAARILHAQRRREPQRLGRRCGTSSPTSLGSVGAILAALVILVDRLGVRRPARQRLHRDPHPRELVVDPPRLDRDPARGFAARHGGRGDRDRDGRDPGRASRSTTCTCGRSPPASRRSPRTCSSTTTTTATRSGSRSSGCSPTASSSTHTTLQVDHSPPDPAADRSGRAGGEADRVELERRRGARAAAVALVALVDGEVVEPRAARPRPPAARRRRRRRRARRDRRARRGRRRPRSRARAARRARARAPSRPGRPRRSAAATSAPGASEGRSGSSGAGSAASASSSRSSSWIASSVAAVLTLAEVEPAQRPALAPEKERWPALDSRSPARSRSRSRRSPGG